jgi:hypothetical protein
MTGTTGKGVDGEAKTMTATSTPVAHSKDGEGAMMKKKESHNNDKNNRTG